MECHDKTSNIQFHLIRMQEFQWSPRATRFDNQLFR